MGSSFHNRAIALSIGLALLLASAGTGLAAGSVQVVDVSGDSRRRTRRLLPGTGAYDAGGDPAIAFGPNGTAYSACQAFNFTSPYQIALLVSPSTARHRS